MWAVLAEIGCGGWAVGLLLAWAASRLLGGRWCGLQLVRAAAGAGCSWCGLQLARGPRLTATQRSHPAQRHPAQPPSTSSPGSQVQGRQAVRRSGWSSLAAQPKRAQRCTSPCSARPTLEQSSRECCASARPGQAACSSFKLQQQHQALDFFKESIVEKIMEYFIEEKYENDILNGRN